MSSQALFPQLASTGSRPLRALEYVEEGVFINLWYEMNSMNCAITRNEELRKIVRMAGLEFPEERDSFVVVSVIGWLGTKEGCLLLEEAKRKSPVTGLARSVLEEIWAGINVRQRALNNGYSALQWILTSDPSKPHMLWPGDPDLIDPVSERDEAVASATIAWLSTAKAQEFLAEAESRISAHHARQLQEFHQRWNLGNLLAAA